MWSTVRILAVGVLACATIGSPADALAQTVTVDVTNASTGEPVKIEACVGESGETGRIWLRTYQLEDGIVVEVAAVGIGISESHIDRIFDPFFTTKQVGSGTGLGLSTAFGIVKCHDGRMTVESKVGEGTTFSVFLPANGAGDRRDGG
jgi:signal transduction histidine kinase